MTLQPAMGDRSDSAKRLIDALRGGTDLDTAALFADLEPDDFTPELWKAVERARAEAIVRAVAQIQKAANQGDWKAAAWWLERAMPDTYQPKQKKEYLPTIEYACPNNHRVTVTRLADSDAVPVCGLCTEPMVRI